MLIIPAVDIRAGSCVRLVRGDPNQSTIYSSDPIQMARRWVEEGAKRLHIIDLDGAWSGQPHHLEIAGKIKKEVGCEIQFGGGLREKEMVKRAIDLGLDKLILGTAALDNLTWVKSALDWHADRLIVALDALNNHVTKEGWQEDIAFTVEEALAKMEAMGFQETIFTDINKDGTLEGPNLEAIKKVVSKTRMNVYASGGVSCLKDVQALKQIPGLKGVVIGKALYTGNVVLKECFQ
ncbi:MAG: 1-(5-phosphoribosyl)-5-[(5-phosphoribosylamino)methylideneamino]imidazole-4-carboxamide isomerase [Elusimicrobia bacterium RIFCSPLOWO2_02_FULL_39_32]|nr:MAG: 1-(5-phosphoribosyl)-5-[(5-phosphoribosylamino)methylideneamino]imidazole-4-carboxamide isomerase [Elusimicrobia bacterium GWA2_38_7]OGR79288.1 MAG: 1-(5-phosphoribosyl)-5-[(5-phosphoribosylamino)methylideneamino]imidazole-4-carboxamide isomerase [Elusimicrobia bacterium RIFCSPHIGHO2_02_FULL_39_36]OGR93189.1 MAG: 1-(5-phosphoribosyl)-5-[(5-phosphoribosylamino)methylideneamino]imidazole-4-carboxamide isomerase [Elusimicrobia bacterium RIFCSPLOWO2_02_FULL_39_32]OGR99414.1 MAG: 1-(5-phospho